MKTLKLITALVLSAVVLLNVMPSVVNANEQTQKQDQKLKVHCTTGSYGQTSTCTAEGEQSQEQKQNIVYVEGQTHKVVNTGLDTYTMIAAALVTVIGASAYIAKRRLA